MVTPERNERALLPAHRAPRALLWALRILWAALPLVLANPFSAAVASWTGPENGMAEGLLWAGWALGAVALLAPRPLGLTAIRFLGPVSLGVAIAVAPGREASASLPALLHTLLLTAMAVAPEVAGPFVNGGAYGNERRVPLRVPPAVRFVLAPLSTVLVGAGVSAGPLLLASERWIAGAACSLVGAALVALLGRSLHALSRRWMVFVPGGVVVHDPLTLAHPVLIPRDHLAGLEAPAGHPPEGLLDLRLGARGGELVAALTQALPFPVVGRNRREVEAVQACAVLVSLSRPGVALQEAARRRLPA